MWIKDYRFTTRHCHANILPDSPDIQHTPAANRMSTIYFIDHRILLFCGLGKGAYPENSHMVFIVTKIKLGLFLIVYIFGA